MSDRWDGRSRIAVGDAVLNVAMLVWLTVAVGPWWLGVLLFIGAGVLNFATQQWLKRRTSGRTGEGLET